MWLAGLFTSISSVIYPTISALVSKNSSSEQQGVALGILTGMRGLCNGLGPALFGLLFWLFNVSLSDGGQAELLAHSSSNAHASHAMKAGSTLNSSAVPVAVHVSILYIVMKFN
jgi:MFS family permease